MSDVITHPYDVVVVGAGAAGLRAAIEAAAGGARTALVCKSLLGKAGTVMERGGIAAHPESTAASENWREHFIDTFVGGGGHGDWRLARLLAREAGARVLELESWGALFDRAGDGRILRVDGAGHRQSRIVRFGHGAGLEVLRTLQHRAREAGVQVHMECSVLRVLSCAGEVRGAVGYERATGALLCFPCRAVVLATGSGMRIWRDPGAAADATGDGAALALNAGAELIDMEFGGTGGIRIDAETSATTIRGLFAAGDAAGGVHGAAAIEGNGIASALVFGRRSGLHAARHALAGECREIDQDILGRHVRELTAPLHRHTGASPYALCRRLQDCMSDLVGAVRREDHLVLALERVRGIARQASSVLAQGPRQYNPAWHLSHELGAMLAFSESVVLSSLERARRELAPAWSLVVRGAVGRLSVHRIQRPLPPQEVSRSMQWRIECRKAKPGSGSGVATQEAESSASMR